MTPAAVLLSLATWFSCAVHLQGVDVRLRDGATYEYIVVGAGAAGSAAAARLALAGRSVLLVEAGGDPGYLSTIPGAAQALLGSQIDYHYETISNGVSCLASINQQCYFSRGRCLGGSTSTNFMMYTRGNPRDFDDLGIPGWYWDDIKPYFLRYEGLQDLSKLPTSSIPYHNTTGTMKVGFFADSENPWHSRIINGFTALNFPVNPDVNAASQIGVSKIVGYVYENERMTTKRGYLDRKDVKKLLAVAKLTKCTGVIIGDNNTAKGITVMYRNFKKLNLYATEEVILSAGALETPKILMLSGIGPAEHLKEFDIPVVADLPVGNNMTDHLLPTIFVTVDKSSGIVDDLIDVTIKITNVAELVLAQSGPLASNGLTDVTTFLNSKCYDFENRQLKSDSSDCELPSLQFIHSYIDRNLARLAGPLFQRGTGLNDDVTKQLVELNDRYAFIVFAPQVLRPFSQGTVRLASGDPLAPPAILPNFLSDERDVAEMVRAINIVEHLMDTPAFKKENASIVRLKFPDCPSFSEDRQAYWACFSRAMTHTSYHAVGTTALGRVLDARLRVRGVRALRVADLGALPALPRGNTAAAAIAIGEKVADLILNGQ